MPIRISGPFRHRDKWRCKVVTGPGAYRWARSCDSPEDAREYAEGLAEGLQEQVDLTVGGLIERYLGHLRTMDRDASTVDGARVHLAAMVGDLAETEAAGVTVQRARAQYAEVAERYAVATQHAALARARALWGWALKRGLLRSNPWTEVEAIGRPKKGKPQLRIDEARRLADVCMHAVMTCDGALGILIGQMMALRVSEIVERVVRDVDDGGRLLWVPDAKTPAGRRAPQIPVALQPAIRARVEVRPPDAPLLRKLDGERPSRRWLTWMLARYCRKAGVPVVCTHALRGQWATIAVDSGALTHAVAEALGHTSFAITAAHYAQPEAVEAAKQRRRLGVLDGGKK